MLRVPSVERTEIERWPVAEAGLTVRVVTCATAAGIRTLADLRAARPEDLLALRHFGGTSLKNVKRFLRRCDQLAAGELAFRDLRELVAELLNGPQWEVLRARYGLLRDELEASRDFYTLQEIGNRADLTRERVRQIEALALGRLSSRFGSACLAGVRSRARAFLAARGGVASFASFAEWPREPWLAGWNPCALTLLLGDLKPGEWVRHRRLFSVYPAKALERIETRALARLRRERAALPLAALRSEPGALPLPAGMPDEALAAVLEQTPGVLGLADGTFLAAAYAAGILADIVQPGRPPMHCDAILQALNERLRPGSRRGIGFVVRALNGSRLFRRPQSGFYERAG